MRFLASLPASLRRILIPQSLTSEWNRWRDQYYLTSSISKRVCRHELFNAVLVNGFRRNRSVSSFRCLHSSTLRDFAQSDSPLTCSQSSVCSPGATWLTGSGERLECSRLPPLSSFSPLFQPELTAQGAASKGCYRL